MKLLVIKYSLLCFAQALSKYKKDLYPLSCQCQGIFLDTNLLATVKVGFEIKIKSSVLRTEGSKFDLNFQQPVKMTVAGFNNRM